jgi:hypothetical protein
MARGFVLVVAMLVAACQQRAAAPLSHEAYIWQRQWTAVLDASLSDSAATFAAYRVLAAEGDRNGRLVASQPDLAVLARVHKPLIAVLRLDGSTPPPDVRAAAAAIGDIVRDWRGAGLALSGVEIDHDCATAKLDDYARWLHDLRDTMPTDMKLSITALPAWNGSGALGALLAVVDEPVLQLHAVQSPQAGLFDAAAARRWIDAFAASAPKPFRIALPAYGLRVQFDDGGAAMAAEAELPRDLDADAARELRVAPDDVAGLLRGLERERPPRLAGIVWFRLPTSDDRRAWSLATLQAVIAGDPLRPVVQVSFDKDDTGANDLVLANKGAVDAALPAAIVIAAFGCDAGDALDGFRLERSGDDWRFVATAKKVLNAGRQRQVGWLRCESIGGVKIDETPPEAAVNYGTQPD